MKQILAVGIAFGLAACAGTPEPAPSDPLAFQEGWVLYPFRFNPAGAEPGCPVNVHEREALEKLKASGFAIADDGERQVFAKAVTLCLASSDPWLRDAIAYEGLTHMLRAKQLSDETKRALLVDLTRRLNGPEGPGFEQPFAALALSEVARTDRVEAFLTEGELIKLLVDAQHWFINIKDYRGFDAKEGWRHGVAHGADLLMQLALNPRIDAEGLRVIVTAVGAQVAPKGHAYVYGESERLVRPVLFAAARGAMDEAKWTEWFKAMATPPAGVDLFASDAGLNWRHNTTAFLQSLYVNVTLGEDKGDDLMLAGLAAALKEMP